MITIIHGAGGIGKTTLITKLGEKFECPLFELSWMPEFNKKNGTPITYEEDELVAIENLVLIAQNYRKHGHQLVLLSDFRLQTLSLFTELIPDQERLVLILVTNDEAELKRRVLTESRLSGYRNWEESIKMNQELKSLPSSEGKKIDVTGMSVDRTCEEAEKIINQRLMDYRECLE